MTTEVICSGCRETVPWPKVGVRTHRHLGTVTMVNLKTGYVFHRCGYDLGDEGSRGVADAVRAGSRGMEPESRKPVGNDPAWLARHPDYHARRKPR